MRWYVWLIAIGLVMVGLEICPFNFQAANGQGGPAPPLPFRMNLQGFTNESSLPSGFPKLVLRQGETRLLEINFAEVETDGNVSLRLWFYGIAPNFDVWENTWDTQKMSLPEGITGFIDPSTVELSNNSNFSADLTIVASPNAKVGDFKVMVDVRFSPSHSGNETAGTDEAFMLEIAPSVPATVGFDMNLALIILIVGLVLSSLVVSAIVLWRRKGTSEPIEPPLSLSG
jgi:hypothetical protein